MHELLLKLSNGSAMVVPDTLKSITTYVLLEQEAWFEKELDFVTRWVRPGMNIVDIGANLGVYSLPLARRVGPGGHVLAYEPGSEPRTLLLKSARRNGCNNLEVSALALSDGAREGRLSIGASSELGSLGGGGDGEAVEVSSLDLDFGRRGWVPDFVKIDAEGEEDRILQGGRGFFTAHSPLVMFEIRAGDAVNQGLRAAFRAMGYDIYRLLGAAPVLVPDQTDQPPDAFELNLFAAKPDRARALAEAGFLVERVVEWQPDDAARERGLALWRAQPFATAPALAPLGSRPVDPAYREALAAYAHWREPSRPLAERWAALALACRLLAPLCTRAPSFARLSSFARISLEAGLREKSVGALQQMIARAGEAAISVAEPLWPAAARFEAIDPSADPGTWFMAATVEQFERARHHSSLFGPPNPHLGWLCATPFASAEMERRLALTALRDGHAPSIPPRLRTRAVDNLNPEIWQAGFAGGRVAPRRR